MDAILRLSLFITLSSIAFLLLCPAIIQSIQFWTKVFEKLP